MRRSVHERTGYLVFNRLLRNVGPGKLRYQGDSARNRRDWSGAAALYQRYLRQRPKDCGIWVQLGNVLKEQGRLDEARAAYGAALELDRNDADAHLQLGHLLKLSRDLRGAAEAYAASYYIDGNMHASNELGTPEIKAEQQNLDPYRFAGLTKSGEEESELRAIARVGASGVFLANWYLLANRDVANAGVDPLWHFMRFGWREARDPSPGFSVRWYLDTYPDVAAASLNPVLHYLDHGWREGRNPSPSFNTNAYTAEHPDTLVHNVNPLTHYYESHVIDASRRRQMQPTSAPPPPEFTELDLRTAYSPLISVILPTYRTEPRFLHDVLRSVRNQSYPVWELCIVDDGSGDDQLLRTLKEAAASDRRIKLKVRDQNGGIARASQDALDMATGEFVAFVDHDDILAEDALGSAVDLLRSDPEIDYIYSDHAMVSEDGKVTHISLKPDWSPEFFLSTNYIVHFKVMRRSMVEAIGGFKGETSIVQDIGMTCRMIEHGARIQHLPKVLYCWRDHPKSVASGTRAKTAIEHLAMQTYDQHLKRRNIPATMEWPTFFRERSIGAYKLRFQPQDRRAALILLNPDKQADVERWQSSLAAGQAGAVQVVPVRTRAARGGTDAAETTLVRTTRDLTQLVETLDAEIILFAYASGRPMRDDWATELLGYFAVDQAVGVVGGKVLDFNLSIHGGGFRLVDDAQLIGVGESDNVDGYWYTARLASNVMAVSAAFMATRRDLFVAAGGIDPTLDASRAGIAYCRAVRQRGARVVYNPWAKVVDPTASLLPGRVALETPETDIYYHPNFSKKVVYTYD